MAVLPVALAAATRTESVGIVVGVEVVAVALVVVAVVVVVGVVVVVVVVAPKVSEVRWSAFAVVVAVVVVVVAGVLQLECSLAVGTVAFAADWVVEQTTVGWVEMTRRPQWSRADVAVAQAVAAVQVASGLRMRAVECWPSVGRASVPNRRRCCCICRLQRRRSRSAETPATTATTHKTTIIRWPTFRNMRIPTRGSTRLISYLSHFLVNLSMRCVDVLLLLFL